MKEVFHLHSSINPTRGQYFNEKTKKRPKANFKPEKSQFYLIEIVDDREGSAWIVLRPQNLSSLPKIHSLKDFRVCYHMFFLHF